MTPDRPGHGSDESDAVLNRVPESSIEHWRQQFGGKLVRFTELAKCGAEVWIEHEGQLYRLRSTRHGKLVLSK